MHRKVTFQPTGWIFLLAFLGCADSPDLPRPEEPLAGKIFEEQTVVMGATDVTAVLMRKVQVTIPATAYPDGTRVTLRIVEPTLLGDSPIVLGAIIYQENPLTIAPAALQVLPTALLPSQPLLVRMLLPAEWTVPTPSGYIDPLRTPSYGFDLLYAHESDQAFGTITYDQPATGSGPSRVFDFAVDKPGVWTLAQWPLPASYEGRWLHTPNPNTSNDRVETLDIVGRTYAWARTDAQGCVSVEHGSLAAPYDRTIECRADGGQTTMHYLSAMPRGLVLDGKSFQLQSDARTPLVDPCAHDGGLIPDDRMDALDFPGGQHD